MQKRAGVTAVAAMMVLALAGCTAPPSPFDGEPTAADELPDHVGNTPEDRAELESVRYAGTAKDADVWIARHADGGNCLVVDAKGDPTLWTIGCSGPLSPFVGTYLRDVGDFEYYPQGIPGGEPEEGWSAIGEYVVVAD
ncbi:hypothetical protein [Microcella indica]|uniref:hypothetical protein n=1 Tax=Microcella indica TaxID=2750620 RepID=UPI0015CF6A3C|nr:hypothetical protein [Microcella indica]